VAGNSPVFLVPPCLGAQWNSVRSAMPNGPVFPLSVLLESAGLADDVCDLVFGRR